MENISTLIQAVYGHFLKMRRTWTGMMLLVISFFATNHEIYSQPAISSSKIADLIQELKVDARGPYRDIRWFCEDGSIILPKEKCPEPGGRQRARYKDEVIKLGKSNHLFLGQILATTSFEEFWDAPNFNMRLKQYQMEKYLRANDDGWIMRKGQFYRGAIQIEDESSWGIDFLMWLVSTEKVIVSQFYLLRQLAKDIPHRSDDNESVSVRALSKAISETYPAFQELRIKIHGQPDESDISSVMTFFQAHADQLDKDQKAQMDKLIKDMQSLYQPTDLGKLREMVRKLPLDAEVRKSLESYVDQLDVVSSSDLVISTAEALAEIRREFLNVKGKKGRLALLDLSNALEEVFFRHINSWKLETIGDASEKICFIGMAAFGTGLIEEWEWDQLSPVLTSFREEEKSLEAFADFINAARSLVEWGTGMTNGVYGDVVNLFTGFEPLAYGFLDDKIRSSILLPLGETVSIMGDFLAKHADFSNHILDLSNQSTMRGLNPGIALGELVVVDGEQIEDVSNDKIYVFKQAPADLKPVAGIMTVSEGNMVSHVQLLARNLGIPNAVLSSENMSELKKYDGQKVFYAVSSKGTVVMKRRDSMSVEEMQLFAKKTRNEDRIRVPIEKIDLNQTSMLDLRDVDASSSGRTCGPKAANLGQLKAMFPEHVVEGIIVPFGIFREHLDQLMPGKNTTYWDFINTTFANAEKQRETKSVEAVDSFVLGELLVLRDAMKQMVLLPRFIADLEAKFSAVLGKKLGAVPVFLRSDTNMEDLKDFTGAGLNLTVFNVLAKDKILEGILSVWASPYTERSFKWRQRYLLNPENVFPSILIIPSVDVDYSGVVITKGIPTADLRDATIAFSRGAGGAVDGQAAESYLLSYKGEDKLLAPAREATYRKLPSSGGSKTEYTTFEKPILNSGNMAELRTFIDLAREKIPMKMDIPKETPLDIELGFKDNKMWLFQVRPFVENKNAATLSYLESITPKIDEMKVISLRSKLQVE